MKHRKRNVKINRLLLALLLATWLFTPHQKPAVAQVSGEEPVFEAAIYASADGDSAIVMQRAVLTGTYFESTGVTENVVVAPDGLTLDAGATSGAYRSDAIRSPLDYTTDIVPAWLADIPPGASVSVEARLSGDGQTWGGWLPVPVEHYPTRNGEYSGALIWVDNAPVYFQFKLTLQASESGASPVFRHLTLFFNNTSQGPSDALAAAQAHRETSSAASDVCPPKPPVISRTAWGCPDGQGSPRWPPTYQSVHHIVINHTATPNSASDWARVVRSIWNYHANTRGWGDAGYQYLIDPLGNIYEGRAGGDDVIGAYDGFNRGSMGIGYIGCYGNCDYLGLSNADPSLAMLEAGNDLMAWKAGQKGIDPLGSGGYCEATLPNIVARSAITCRGGSLSPGDRLRAHIPSMRDEVQRKIEECHDSIYGTVLLQGRTDHSGSEVSLFSTILDFTTTLTDQQGRFSAAPTANYQWLTAYHACYLTAAKYFVGIPGNGLQGDMGTITLPGGDVDGDNCIDILDLTAIGGCNGMRAPLLSCPSCADVNGDGVVDIYDLVIAAANFGKCGPVEDWE